MKAPIAQTAAEADSQPSCASFFFWGLEIVQFISKTRILAGSRFSHP